jgi:hypothetical protein
MIIGRGNIMSHYALVLATIKTDLEKIANQSKGLGEGLEHAAPVKANPNSSAKYLKEVHEMINKNLKDFDPSQINSDEKKLER